MNLIPRKHQGIRDPFMDLLDLQSHMNDLFDISLSRWPAVNGKERPSLALDIYDGKDHFTVKADIPGMKKEDIEISIQEGVLTIRGEKKEETEKNEKGVLRTERFYGMFERSVALPSVVDEAKVKASYKDGVLELVIPKKEESKPKQIKIDVA